MDKHGRIIDSIKCCIYNCGSSDPLLIQPILGEDVENIDQQIAEIHKLSKETPFTMVTFQVRDWNHDLTPWEAPFAFGNESYGCGAADTLKFITEILIPEVTDGEACTVYLGGYSLAGLFSLWAAYQTDLFAGVAAASPSVWYPGWPAFAQENTVKVPKIYLSLGTKEEKTRNPEMRTVGDNIRRQEELLEKDAGCLDCTLEMNPGNHFKDSDIRMAKGFAWLLGKELQ